MLKITHLYRPENCYYLIRQDPNAKDSHFTFKLETKVFNAMDGKLCEMCVINQGKQVGNINLSYLCRNCQNEEPNSFVLKKGGKNYLVRFDNPKELVSLKISERNVSKEIHQFNLLDNLVPMESFTAKTEIVKNQLEYAFVEYCFNSSKLSEN